LTASLDAHLLFAIYWFKQVQQAREHATMADYHSICRKETAGRRLRIALRTAALAMVLISSLSDSVLASSRSEIDRNVHQALVTLYQTTPGAKVLADHAKGILVFPNVVKGGFIVAGQYGDGALRRGGKTAGYYRSLAASVGFQAGAQSYSYALFFMDNASLQYLQKSQGWELGTGPEIVVLDKGFEKNLSTTTLHKGIYAFVFNAKGLMGGIDIQGSKITRIHPAA
jgi:lipid-binding SYLF domain-containing protein